MTVSLALTITFFVMGYIFKWWFTGTYTNMSDADKENLKENVTQYPWICFLALVAGGSFLGGLISILVFVWGLV